MWVKIRDIQREHDRLIAEHRVHGFKDVFLNGATAVEEGIVDVPTHRYKAIQAWKKNRILGLVSLPPPLHTPAKEPSQRKPRPTKEESWKAKGPKMWAQLHARPELMTSQENEKQWLSWFSGQVDCGDCRRHWMQLMQEMPPDLSSKESYYAWTVAAHNSVNRRLGKPEWTPPTQAFAAPATPAATPLVFNLGSTGLGDAICGLYAACGLADSTGRKVIYYAHSANWINRASHPNVEIRPRIAGDMGTNPCKDMKDYGEQINGAETRVKFYCDRLAAQLGVPPFEGKRPQFVNTAHKES
jgi:hypothetical protein